MCLDDNFGGYKCNCEKGFTGDNCSIGNKNTEIFKKKIDFKI